MRAARPQGAARMHARRQGSALPQGRWPRMHAPAWLPARSQHARHAAMWSPAGCLPTLGTLAWRPAAHPPSDFTGLEPACGRARAGQLRQSGRHMLPRSARRAGGVPQAAGERARPAARIHAYRSMATRNAARACARAWLGEPICPKRRAHVPPGACGSPGLKAAVLAAENCAAPAAPLFGPWLAAWQPRPPFWRSLPLGLPPRRA